MATLKIGNYKIHPICAEVPDPTDEEYAAMAESMKARGIQKPVLIWGGEVVSGKTRVRIGVEFDIRIPELKWHPKSNGKDAVEREIRTLLMDEDYNRRHLATGQRAIFAAPLVTTDGKGRKTNAENSAFSQNDAAKSAGVSVDSIQQATAVLESGSAALIEAVRDGDIAVSDAEKIVDLPKSEQNAAVKAVEKGEAKTVSAAAGKTRKTRPPKNDASHPLPIPELAAREPGDDPVEPAHDPAAPKDKSGNALPDRPELHKAFSSNDLFHSTEMARNVIQTNCLKIVPLIPDGKEFKTVIDKLLKAMFHTIEQYRPAYVCNACNGGKCQKCRKRGYTTWK